MLKPYHTAKSFSKVLALAAVSLLPLLSAQDNWPKGIDPSTLLVNTKPEPDLNASGFVSLFNGRDLSGWEVKGSQMEFKVENGEIVGICTPELQPNSFLCTEKSYDNFIFTAEFKWDVIGNSGIMFRADTKPADEKGVERVFGYQSEMDPSERGWTGGIYGEFMEGWKYPLSRDNEHEKARNAVKDYHSWNRMTIYANGNEIRTWINGVPCSFLIDNDRKEGVFGLQVHSGKQGTIRWRDIRVKTISETVSWKNLFPGNDFSQWTQVDGSPVKPGWTIEKSIITRDGDAPGDIITKNAFRDFELLFDWKISEGGNSGVKYRTRGNLGLEYQILDDAKHKDGKIVTHRSGDLYDIKAAPSDKPIQAVGQWNNSSIIAQGNEIRHYLNGEKVIDIDLSTEEWRKAFSESKYKENVNFGHWTGPILLQDHGDEVQFRNIRIRQL